MNRRPSEPSARARPADALEGALEQAISGDETKLRAFLTRESGLPGPRANLPLAQAFAKACGARGARADAVALRLATLDADRAPGASPLEFLPVCGVLALGVRAGSDVSVRTAFLAVLHDAAEDLRWRVRDAVPEALARIGAATGGALVRDVATWMDGFFQAAAVLRALVRNEWLSALGDAEDAVARLDEAFRLAEGAERAAARYPGYKALLDALALAPGILAARFGAPVFDLLVAKAGLKNPALREVTAKGVVGQALARRYPEEIARVVAALSASAPKRRDPRTDVGPTRGRGRKRRRH